jgi:hypothetical protein
VYYVDYGGLFYRDRQAGRYAPIVETAEHRLTTNALHPYFGPTHRPGVRFEVPAQLLPPGAAPPRLQTNNFGFVSPRNYPVARVSDRQFLVGLFGGSVGLWFCEVGAPRLVEALQRHERFRGKEIVPLCFSHEGYKQPQQLLVLAYFLSLGQSYDLVINIDGFNEVALGSLNAARGPDISMPVRRTSSRS